MLRSQRAVVLLRLCPLHCRLQRPFSQKPSFPRKVAAPMPPRQLSSAKLFPSSARRWPGQCAQETRAGHQPSLGPRGRAQARQGKDPSCSDSWGLGRLGSSLRANPDFMPSPTRFSRCLMLPLGAASVLGATRRSQEPGERVRPRCAPRLPARRWHPLLRRLDPLPFQICSRTPELHLNQVPSNSRTGSRRLTSLRNAPSRVSPTPKRQQNTPDNFLRTPTTFAAQLGRELGIRTPRRPLT